MWSKIFGTGGPKPSEEAAEEVEVVTYTVPQLAEAYGFYPSTEAERYGDLVDLSNRVDSLSNTVEGLSEFIALIQPYLERGATLPWGGNLATLACEWAPLGDVADGVDAGETFISAAKTVYEQQPSALSVSIYAYVVARNTAAGDNIYLEE